MKMITGMCVLLLALGVICGWFFFEGVVGSALGLLLAGCVAVPLYTLGSVFTRNARVVRETSSQETSSSINLDPSQLSKSAYNRLTDGM